MPKATDKKSSVFYAHLIGDVDDNSIRGVIQDIDTANTLSHVKEIVLVMASKGGWIYDAVALFDHIKSSKKPIDIIVEGYCMSCAVMILQAGRKRFSRPLTSFMVHPSSSGDWKSKPYDEFLTMVEEYKRNHDLFVKLTTQRAGLDRKEFEKLYEPRKYMSAEKAKELNLIDEILT